MLQDRPPRTALRTPHDLVGLTQQIPRFVALKTEEGRWPLHTGGGFVAKGTTKSQVTLQHSKLASKADADRVRGLWTERLNALATMLRRMA